MNGSNETTRILNAESQEQLIRARDAELAKILKLRFVFAELRRMRVKDINLPDKEQVEWALKMLSIRSYMDLNDNNECLLNLEMCRHTPISYTERKAVRQHLVERLEVTCKRIAEFGQRMRAELPEVFVDTHLDSANSSTNTKNAEEGKTPTTTYAIQLQELELQRRQNVLKLVELRNRKCAFLKAAAELKLGPYQKHELEITYAQSRTNHVKAMLLRGFLINELVTRSDHSLKAIKEVEHFIDEALEQAEKVNS